MARDVKTTIIEAAKPLFGRYGFKKTSVDDLARAAHVSKATLYSYFKSKQQLFAEVIRSEGERVFGEMDAAIADADDHIGRVRAFFTGFLGAMDSSAILKEATSEAIVELMPMAHEAASELDGEGRRRLTALVRAGMDDGVFTIDDDERAARGLDLVTRSLHLACIARTDLDHFRRDLPVLLDLLVRGLTARSAKGRSR